MESALRTELDRQIPVKKFQLRSKYKSWVEDSTKEIMIQRDRAREEAVRTNTEQDWITFRSLRNKVSALVRKDKIRHFNRLYEKADKDVKTLCRVTKDQLGWNTGGPPSSLVVAFDMVNFDQLERKMQRYNFSTHTIQWFHNYLTGRSQYVSIGTKKSRMTPVTCGVPQGSVLGPILYSVFTNELPDSTAQIRLTTPKTIFSDQIVKAVKPYLLRR